MRLIVFLLLGTAMVWAQTTYPPRGYRLVWSDDFNGSQLDDSKWMYRHDVKMESSQRPKNVSVKDGKLVIHLRKEHHRGKQYTGGGVISKRKFRYAYYEARAKMHGFSGWHQSVWSMFGGDGSTTYPEMMRTEIDGMELDSDMPAKGHMGLIIWQSPEKKRGVSCSAGVYRAPLGFDASTDYHTYGYEWIKDKINFYLDGELRCSLDYPPTEGVHDDINFWLTAIAVEKLSGKVDESRLPGQMLIDHAYVYIKPQTGVVD